MKKKNNLYVCMLIGWLALLAFFVPQLLREFTFVEFNGWKAFLTNTILIFNGLFIMYFWLNGVKDVIYVLWYYINKKSLTEYSNEVEKIETPSGKSVVMLYCTCNDFEPEPLLKSMKQDYPNVKTVILDDSKKQSYIDEIDKFAKENNVEVVRRTDHSGFKAGNLNNYLRGRDDYDYFVILDSDEIIPENFVSECLKYFVYFDNIGIVQCNHISTRNINKFMQLFHIGVNSHWPTYQTVKHHNGFMSLLGHGAMVSRGCYEKTGGLPHVVAEDLCFSIEARNQDLYTAFAPNIICEEEYPVDYLAFKKRHNKWTQGNMEFIKRYTKRILQSNMSWFEKMDIFLFTYNLPLTAFFSFYIMINIMILPALNYTLHYPAWLLIPTVIFFLAPMANDFITYVSKMNFFKLIKYCFMVFLLYGSMLWVSMKASFLGALGKKAVFLVTPKEEQKVSFIEAVKAQWDELLFAVVMAAISFYFTGSVMPVLLIAVPSVLSVLLCLYANPATQ